MRNFYTPSDDELRKILLDAPSFEWPTFDHMPLNCFDLAVAVLTFPGDISESRAYENSGKKSGYADYKIDINNLDTCPRIDEVFDFELWNEKSITARWLLGRVEWACIIDAGEFAVRQGHFSAGLTISRFQNIAGINNLTDLDQLKHALFCAIEPEMEKNHFRAIKEDAIFSKNINGRTWLIARSLNPAGNPVYRVSSAIDHQTAFLIPATLGNSWFWEEDVPEEIEQKHLASFWDFLGHIHLSHTRDEEVQVGTTIREAPGQATKLDDFEW